MQTNGMWLVDDIRGGYEYYRYLRRYYSPWSGKADTDIEYYSMPFSTADTDSEYAWIKPISVFAPALNDNL
jgi:hypothetical protein